MPAKSGPPPALSKPAEDAAGTVGDLPSVPLGMPKMDEAPFAASNGQAPAHAEANPGGAGPGTNALGMDTLLRQALYETRGSLVGIAFDSSGALETDHHEGMQLMRAISGLVGDGSLSTDQQHANAAMHLLSSGIPYEDASKGSFKLHEHLRNADAADET
jgi:hypothetical protein